jgi:hypothetical protein
VAVHKPRLSKRWRVTFAVAGLALAALVGVLGGLNVGGWRERVLGRGGPSRIQSLAVLPLANLSGLSVDILGGGST